MHFMSLFEYSWWEMQYENISLWFYADVLVTTNLIQIAIILIAFLSAKILANKTAVFFQYLNRKTGQYGGLKRLWKALEIVSMAVIWLALQWLVVFVAKIYGWPYTLIKTVSSLLAAWIVIRIASQSFRNAFFSNFIALCAWVLATLNILGLLPETLELLDSLSIKLNTTDVSLLLIIKIISLLALLIWLASAFSDLVEKYLRKSSSISAAARVLLTKVIRIGFIGIAIIISINSTGIDLTALAVFSGALAVGLGFGLQKIFSNLISGFILLLDKSIKPGDVISLGQTYGWINNLSARYVSVITRDGTEHLIPNEELITQRVENWSHSHNLVRLRIPVGIAYHCNPHTAIKLCVDAAHEVPRVLTEPAPRCLLKGFGDSSIDLELRVWIGDPENGRGSVISDILLEIWDSFHKNQIEIPYPQRDIHIRTMTKGHEIDENELRVASNLKSND